MAVTKALGKISGLKNVKVDLANGEATFENPQNEPMEAIQRAIESAGFKVQS